MPGLADLADQVSQLGLVDLDHRVDLGFLELPWAQVDHHYLVDLLARLVNLEGLVDLVDQVDQVDLWDRQVQVDQQVPLDRQALEGQEELEVQVLHNKQVCMLGRM